VITQEQASKRTYGFGIIGTGNIATAHLEAIRQLPNAFVAGVQNRSTEKAERFAARHNVEVYPDLDAMLRDDRVEVVCICTPSGAHLEPAVAAARAGRHLVVEKPLEVTSARCQELIAAAEAADVKLATIFMSRFSDTMHHIKATLEAGALGRLLQGDAYVKWFRSQEYYDSGAWRGTWQLDGGGALMNQGIHQVDLLLWLMGPVEEVFAYADILNHQRIEVEDTLVAVLRYKSGALGMISAATSLYPGKPKELHLHGANGTIIVQDDTITAWQLAGLTSQEQEEVVQRFRQGTSGTFSDPMAMSFENHRRQLADFLKAIEENRRPMIDGWEGMRSVRLIEAIYESARTRRPVHLQDLDEQAGVSEGVPAGRKE
jgi:UDP-N-acetyl-2-amino-2-deoxyglucuronate dehydrogenase